MNKNSRINEICDYFPCLLTYDLPELTAPELVLILRTVRSTRNLSIKILHLLHPEIMTKCALQTSKAVA